MSHQDLGGVLGCFSLSHPAGSVGGFRGVLLSAPCSGALAALEVLLRLRAVDRRSFASSFRLASKRTS